MYKCSIISSMSIFLIPIQHICFKFSNIFTLHLHLQLSIIEKEEYLNCTFIKRFFLLLKFIVLYLYLKKITFYILSKK